MSIALGAVRQIAFVTPDIEASMRFFAQTAGIGPWFVAERLKIDGYRYRGQPGELEMSAALANSGSLQVELIQQHNDAPSIYRDWQRRHPGGEPMQHVSSWVEDYEGTCAAARGRGFDVVQEGRSANGPFLYFQHPDNPDFTYEVVAYNEARRFTFEAIAAAAVGWDGRDPVRRGWPTRPQG